MISDTHPEAERIQAEALSRLSAAERIAQGRSLSVFSARLSLRAIARANPGWSDAEVRLKLMELLYGEELVSRYRKYLKAT